MLLEFRAAEGGHDAYLFSRELARAFAAYARRLGCETSLDEDLSRTLRLTVTGAQAARFAELAGTHRIQREPKHDRRGRRHTSTVTVAVLDELSAPCVTVHDDELEVQHYRGTGKGGQHRNKNATAVRLTHRPSGLVVAREDSRSQWQNYQAARADLVRLLTEAATGELVGAQNRARRDQIATGERPAKAWTHNTQRDESIEHASGRRWRLSEFLRGKLE